MRVGTIGTGATGLTAGYDLVTDRNAEKYFR